MTARSFNRKKTNSRAKVRVNVNVTKDYPSKECKIGFTSEKGQVHPALSHYFSYCFYKTAMRLRCRIAEAIAKHGLIPAQLGILEVLSSSGPLNQITLGEGLGIDKTTMVNLIDGLERLEFVERRADSQDRRVKLINVTQKGRKFAGKFAVTRSAIEERFLSILSEEDRKVLRRVIPLLLKSS